MVHFGGHRFSTYVANYAVFYTTKKVHLDFFFLQSNKYYYFTLKHYFFFFCNIPVKKSTQSDQICREDECFYGTCVHDSGQLGLTFGICVYLSNAMKTINI